MKQLKDAIAKAIGGAGIKKALEQESAIVYWKEVVGQKISERTTAERVDRGVLVVKAESPTWRQELHMQKDEIINKLNKKIGARAIREIRFI